MKFVEGDIFVNKYQADVVAHGCNCQGIMGAGIALEFKKRNPDMYQRYRRFCLAGIFTPGRVFAWKTESYHPNVLNLATENTMREGAKLEYIRTALRTVKEIVRTWSFDKLALPAIGTGYGGLPWPDVKEVMIEELGDAYFPVIVYERYKPGC